MKACPFCGEQIQDTAVVCKHCGRDLSSAAPELGAPPSPAGQRRKGLAIASLVLGILGLPTLGLLGIGALAGLVMGIVALVRASNRPTQYAGKGMAITGIVLNVVAIVVVPIMLGVIGAIAVPSLVRARMASNEASAITALRAINSAQTAFAAGCGAGSYAPTLESLGAPPADGGLPFLSTDLGSDPVTRSGYAISLVAGSVKAEAPTACNGATVVETYFASATPVSPGSSGRRFFATNQGVTIYESASLIPAAQSVTIEGATPIR